MYHPKLPKDQVTNTLTVLTLLIVIYIYIYILINASVYTLVSNSMARAWFEFKRRFQLNT